MTVLFKEMKRQERRTAVHLFCCHSYSSVSSASSPFLYQGYFGQEHILKSMEMSVQYLNLAIKDHTLTGAMVGEGVE